MARFQRAALSRAKATATVVEKFVRRLEAEERMDAQAARGSMVFCLEVALLHLVVELPAKESAREWQDGVTGGQTNAQAAGGSTITCQEVATSQAPVVAGAEEPARGGEEDDQISVEVANVMIRNYFLVDVLDPVEVEAATTMSARR